MTRADPRPVGEPYGQGGVATGRAGPLLLIILNGHFQGIVTGETFNGTGKTDILIRVEDRNIFIGECKFWKSPATISKTLDRLLGYMVWRDTKGALLLFIRERDASAAIKKAVAEMAKHPRFKQALATQHDGERYDFLFRSKGDPQREIKLALIPFALSNLPETVELDLDE